ncbi:YtzI protein [Virgibacillus indicus]|uniref:YtzI protein n=1 Tax=Virgibacillus indicus TaxID=2024554 RepID=UPI0026D3CB81
MGAYIVVGAVSLLVVAMVVILSMVTISKGYGYKHSIDSLPDEETSEEDMNHKKD